MGYRIGDRVRAMMYLEGMGTCLVPGTVTAVTIEGGITVESSYGTRSYTRNSLRDYVLAGWEA